MSEFDQHPYGRVFSELAKIAQAQKTFTHQTDDFGWPLCACGPCATIRNAMDAAHIGAILRGGDPESSIDRHPEREFDHDGDLGREHFETMRDNRTGGGSSIKPWVQIADALPVIEAPSIAPTTHPEHQPVQRSDDTASA